MNINILISFSPVLYVLVPEVVHVASCTIILRINLFSLFCFGNTYKVANIFYYKFSFRKAPRCNDASTLSFKIFDLHEYINVIVLGVYIRINSILLYMGFIIYLLFSILLLASIMVATHSFLH